MLDERAQHLLKTLIESHIDKGEPVGSKTLLESSGLKISTATIRNVMSDLETLGLVSSPHVSAGRVPTDRAYRLFIDTMLVTEPLDPHAMQQMSHVLRPDHPSRLIAQASALLSELTRLTGVVAINKQDGVILHQVEFLRLAERKVLMILVLPDGEVENRLLFPQQDLSQSQLIEAGNYINEKYAGLSFVEIRARLRDELSQLHQDMQTLMQALGEAVEDDYSAGYAVSGEGNLLQIQDWSSDMKRLQELFQLFEQKTELLQLLDAGRTGQGIQIFIGHESGIESLDACSVITAPYSADGQLLGTLAVIGPQRMHYENVIPVVDIAARMLSNALSQHQ